MNLIGGNFFSCEPFVGEERSPEVGIVKDDLESVEHTHVFPARRGSMIVFGKDGFKPIVVHKMVLRSDVSRGEIADKANRFSMNR